jgi:hypothetical protein
VKWLSGLCLALGIAMFVNAITATWPFDPTEHTQVYRVLDVALGVGFWLLAWVLFLVWRSHEPVEEQADPPKRADLKLP